MKRLIVVLALLLAACSSTIHDATPTTTTRSTPTQATTIALPSGMTAEQLNAHLGVGVPIGWVPVDFEKARVWVPSSWYLRFGPSCIPGQGSSPFFSAGTETTDVSCDIPQSVAPTQDVVLARSASRSRPLGMRTVNGYQVYDLKSPHAEWNLYEVPQLSVRIATRGSLGPRILNTLGPSAVALALDPAYQITPTTWHTITEDNVALRVPPTWTAQVDTYDCSPTTAHVIVFRPFHGVAGCGSLQGPGRIAGLTITTVWIYLSPASSTLTPTRSGQAIATLHHGTTTITIYTEQNDSSVLDLYVHKARSKITHVLTLFLGRDGRTAGGVLASIGALT